MSPHASPSRGLPPGGSSPARPQNRAVRVVAALVALLVVAAGVTFFLTRASAQPSAQPSPAPSPTATKVPAERVDPPAVLDPTSVENLEIHQESTADTGDARSISTVAIPGEHSLGRAFGRFVDATTQAYEAAVDPTATGNELNVGWDLVLAQGDVLGVHASTYAFTGGANGELGSQTFYTDLPRATTTWSADLLTADGRKQAAEWAGAALAAAGLGFGEPVPSSEDTFRDVRLGPDGAATLVFSPGLVSARADGELAVRLEPDATRSVLSAVGKQLAEVAASGAPFMGIAPPPVEEPPVAAPPPASPDAPDCSVLKCIALTFDDGPGKYTSQLLDTLAEKQARATFFLVGRSVQANPHLVRREVAEGHAVGNHTWSHPDLSKLGTDQISQELQSTADAVEAASGVRPTLVRPPYGATSDTVTSVLSQRNEPAILWNVDTEDWKNKDSAMTSERALAGARPGAILLMHDIHASTVSAVPGIVDSLRAAGYTLVTVPDLLGHDLVGGHKYFNR
ncbi:polysaccharide deacetylase family protein [Oerskovia sp. Root22]|uniref:polysaccharide deacetylase family protein n=1 Tax=Oerskovia sp. Root22 TaxID=1736494 RepID=UPI000A64A6D1|nr:polysaccharide deacetylase family protein [Oerskovia sp. Root22]